MVEQRGVGHLYLPALPTEVDVFQSQPAILGELEADESLGACWVGRGVPLMMALS